MASVGFVIHEQRAGAVSLARRTAAWLEQEGHRPHVLDGSGVSPLRPPGRSDLPALDLAVSLGGDGTMLRTVDLVASAGVPVLGVNLGHLGYLTTVEPDRLQGALTRFLAGDYRVDARMTLDVTVRAAGGTEVLQGSALNDIVLQRPAGQHTVRAELAVNGARFLSYAADSLIIATPTGSTAYNLSARGPIVSPRARVQIVTPVAPHMLFDRALVLAADEVVSVTPAEGHAADVVIDGWPVAVLRDGQELRCCPGRNDALLVTFGDRDFHHILKSKFNLADR